MEINNSICNTPFDHRYHISEIDKWKPTEQSGITTIHIPSYLSHFVLHTSKYQEKIVLLRLKEVCQFTYILSYG